MKNFKNIIKFLIYYMYKFKLFQVKENSIKNCFNITSTAIESLNR